MNNNFSIFLNLLDPKVLEIDSDKSYLLIKVALPICLHLDIQTFLCCFQRWEKIRN